MEIKKGDSVIFDGMRKKVFGIHTNKNHIKSQWNVSSSI